ncbi:hypothetical protein CVU82_00725 [Candidatus Falkowbacteria bacterium HGW-Falkowbacteria-1]|jgi:hypothetical protein|uniref:Uncharacterized protein n=1 Tax=Candidatus Falkowbacteria bacterium HGW-Falkowbacteria-1 TaxID=2013768 RepID=A0A2N2EAG9_9BACT|nr:MAG: hypothetical protein CVU82_00725 [Candidatus Falkowbacteria bacterium HGW-Falkowbacteria-1]
MKTKEVFSAELVETVKHDLKWERGSAVIFVCAFLGIGISVLLFHFHLLLGIDPSWLYLFIVLCPVIGMIVNSFFPYSNDKKIKRRLERIISQRKSFNSDQIASLIIEIEEKKDELEELRHETMLLGEIDY